MRKVGFLLLLAATLLAGDARASDVNESVRGSLLRVFGERTRFEFQSIPLSDADVAKVRSLAGARYGKAVALHIARSGGTVVGYGIVDDVMGKEKPITYMVLVGRDLAIKDVEVLVYRESYGGEIAYDAFRKQYRGKTTGADLIVGSGIQNISGATISVNAITFGVKKVLAILTVLHDSGRLPE